jgi:predicted kinase
MKNAENHLIIMYGLIGSGKTFFSKVLESTLHSYKRYNSDEVRKLLGKDKWDSKDTPEVNKYIYSNITESLKEYGVIVDSANKTILARSRLYALGREAKVPIIVIECHCPEQTSLKRIASRPVTPDTVHKNDPSVYHDFAKLVESPALDFIEDKNDDVSYIKLDTETHKVQIVHSRTQSEALIGEIARIASKLN